MEPINFLSFDTSANHLKVSLSSNGKDIVFDIKKEFKHIENLLPTIIKSFDDSGLSKKDLTHVLVCIGPGSFTGIRIGVATALGLTFKTDITCLGYSVFHLYKYLFSDLKDSVIIPIIDAKKKRFYCSFLTDSGIIEMFDYEAERILSHVRTHYADKKIILAGKDAHMVSEIIGDHLECEIRKQDGYSAEDILGFSKWALAGGIELSQPKPIYLRKSEAEIALEKKHSQS